MTQYNTLNVKFSDWQPNKLKSGIKNSTQVTLNLSSNAVGEYNDETNLVNESGLHKKDKNVSNKRRNKSSNKSKIKSRGK